MAVEHSYRLPRHARPRRYDLELSPDLAGARFEGQVSIAVEVVEASDRLVLHAADLVIRGAEMTTPDERVVTPRVTMEEAEQMLVLAFPDQLEPGLYRLRIGFTGSLNDRLRGFYRSTFVDEDGVEQVVALTQFESTDARRAFPCWDEPDFKAVFGVTLVVEDGLAAIANGPLLSSTRRDDGRIEMRFADTMVMSTYLVAFVIGPYDLSEPEDVDGIPLRIAAPRGRLGQSSYAAEAARHALEFSSGYFGIPYPGGKLDHVAVPDFAFGAMENLGCVTYRDRLLLVDLQRAAQTELQNIATVIAHETAHMWFGDLVTMKWWNGIWLNEAFATFMELTTSEAFRPEWQVWTAFGTGKAAALAVDGLRATRPVEYPVGRPEEAEGMFDVLTYQKGGSVLRMLEQYLGPEVFRKGISHYLATHAYGNTETADLWDALDVVSGEPVGDIMATWIEQGGYPVIHAEPGDRPHTLRLRQERFLYSSPTSEDASPVRPGDTGAPSPDDRAITPGVDAHSRWVVPVHIRASVEGRVVHSRLLLKDGPVTHSFPGAVDWAVVNDGGWGYYRVRYHDDLLSRLAAADPATVLLPLERLQLVDDAWAAVMAGHSPLEHWAAAATSVASEPDPDIWASLAGSLRSLTLVTHTQHPHTPDPHAAGLADSAALEAFARRLTESVADALGWDAPPGEDARLTVARGRILAARAHAGRDEHVIAEAERRYQAHLADRSGAALTPDLIRTAAAIAVSQGDARTWDRTLEAYRTASEAVEQVRYLYALAETPDPQLRLQLLEMTTGPHIRSQDGPFVVASALARPGAAVQVWDWIETHWADLNARFPGSLVIHMLEAVAAITDEELATRVRRFCAETDVPVSAVRLDQVLERMDLSVALAGRLRGGLSTALDPS